MCIQINTEYWPKNSFKNTSDGLLLNLDDRDEVIFGQTFIGEDDDDQSDFRATSSECDYGLEDIVVPARDNAVSEQDDAIENDVVMEEKESRNY